jgi:hypothetical protein
VKIDFTPDYIAAICYLLEHGEESLLAAVASSTTPTRTSACRDSPAVAERRPLRNAAPVVSRLHRPRLPSSFVGFFDAAVQPHLDQMQHAPINDPTRHRL